MEEKIIEQSNLEPEANIENTSTSQEDSMLGKFKDAKSLLDAYNSLQAEFTRKSQKLAELQKENDKSALFSYNDSIENIYVNFVSSNDISADRVFSFENGFVEKCTLDYKKQKGEEPTFSKSVKV